MVVRWALALGLSLGIGLLPCQLQQLAHALLLLVLPRLNGIHLRPTPLLAGPLLEPPAHMRHARHGHGPLPLLKKCSWRTTA